MTVREKQSYFAVQVGRLIARAVALEFEVTLGEAWRSPEEAARLAKLGKGIAGSLHTKRLAIDLNLFKNGKYLTSTASHLELGEWWEEQTTPEYRHCWGGRFGDGNHYSVAHGGKR